VDKILSGFQIVSLQNELRSNRLHKSRCGTDDAELQSHIGAGGDSPMEKRARIEKKIPLEIMEWMIRGDRKKESATETER